MGTILICAIAAITAIPIGVGMAILIEEFKPKWKPARRALDFAQLNLTNLAGVPSIVYGLLGLTAFASMFGLFGNANQPSWELGTRYYDQFSTAAGQQVFVPVDRVDSPPVDLRSAREFVDVNYDPVAATIVEGLAQRQREIEDRFGELARAFLPLYEANRTPAVLEQFESQWQAAGFNATLAEVRDPIIARFSELEGKTGRQLRRSAEGVLEPLLKAELIAELGVAIDANAVPNRVTRGQDSPWYMRLPFGRSVLAGGLTLMLVILPVIIIATQESLRAVPRSLRQASLAMGATTWQTTWRVTLPAAVPGTMTGIILAMSRAIGEAAPILIIAGIVYITFVPSNLMDDFTAMPLQVYNWASRPQADFHDLAAAGIILLLGVLLVFNGIAVLIRQKTQRQV
jgi:phosphate transport system permease protein